MSKQSDHSQLGNDKLIVGAISGVFGVKGWVKIFSETDPRENILNYSPWFIEINKQWQIVKVVSSKKHGKAVIAQLEGVNDRDQAETLRRARIAINPSQLPDTSESEFYWRDLKDLNVSNSAGFEFGKVVEILETGANDVLVIRSNNKDKDGKYEEYLIPYIWQQVILKVDLEQGIIEVDWLPEYLND